MHLPQDWKELLGLFNSHRVEYLVVGAHALALHGVPRYTGDLDAAAVFARRIDEQIVSALASFGFGSLALAPDDFAQPGRVVQLGVIPNWIDILTSLTGLNFQEAATGSVQGELDGVPVPFIGSGALRRNKMATGRPKDLADAASLLGEAAE